jgi:hypothetical protein
VVTSPSDQDPMASLLGLSSPRTMITIVQAQDARVTAMPTLTGQFVLMLQFKEPRAMVSLVFPNEDAVRGFVKRLEEVLTG